MFDIWPVMNKCTVVAKRELFFAWPFGLAAWLCGLIFINRMQSDNSRKQLCKASNNIKNKKIKLWIFPEGTRRNTGQLHPFKKGAFHVAIDGQLPILPVVFSSYKTFLDRKNKNFTSGRIIVSTLPPIPTVGLTKNNLDELMQHTYDVMDKEYHSITKEVNDDLNYPELVPFVPKTIDIPSTPVMSIRTINDNRNGSAANDRNIRRCLDNDDDPEFGHHQYTTFIQTHNHRTTAPPTAN